MAASAMGTCQCKHTHLCDDMIARAHAVSEAFERIHCQILSTMCPRYVRLVADIAPMTQKKCIGLLLPGEAAYLCSMDCISAMYAAVNAASVV